MSSAGTCSPAFKEVREEFERSFTEREEVGAAVILIFGALQRPVVRRTEARDQQRLRRGRLQLNAVRDLPRGPGLPGPTPPSAPPEPPAGLYR
jgi:hypothetical protein